MLSAVFKPIAFKAAKLHLAAAGQPETEEQQLCRQLIRVLAVFFGAECPLNILLSKIFYKKFFASQDFGQQYATISKTSVL